MIRHVQFLVNDPTLVYIYYEATYQTFERREHCQ